MRARPTSWTSRSAAARPGVYDFDITVRSVDKGWDYYADAFEVLSPDGKVLGQRILLHPHETEQPFTRDLYGVRVPAGITEVVVRARHKPRGYGGDAQGQVAGPVGRGVIEKQKLSGMNSPGRTCPLRSLATRPPPVAASRRPVRNALRST